MCHDLRQAGYRRAPEPDIFMHSRRFMISIKGRPRKHLLIAIALLTGRADVTNL